MSPALIPYNRRKTPENYDPVSTTAPLKWAPMKLSDGLVYYVPTFR